TSTSIAVQATTTAVLMPSHSLRLPAASDSCPVIGARSATASPAIRSAVPSCADTTCSGPKAFCVMYTLKTNVVTTALNAADPQSHSDHANTVRFLMAGASETAGAAGAISLMLQAYRVGVTRGRGDYGSNLKVECDSLKFGFFDLTLA